MESGKKKTDKSGKNELKDLLKPVDSDPYSAYCPICKSPVRAHLADLNFHTEAMKHKTET